LGHDIAPVILTQLIVLDASVLANAIADDQHDGACWMISAVVLSAVWVGNVRVVLGRARIIAPCGRPLDRVRDRRPRVQPIAPRTGPDGVVCAILPTATPSVPTRDPAPAPPGATDGGVTAHLMTQTSARLWTRYMVASRSLRSTSFHGAAFGGSCGPPLTLAPSRGFAARSGSSPCQPLLQGSDP
jgi:hypothetical protein